MPLFFHVTSVIFSHCILYIFMPHSRVSAFGYSKCLFLFAETERQFILDSSFAYFGERIFYNRIEIFRSFCSLFCCFSPWNVSDKSFCSALYYPKPLKLYSWNLSFYWLLLFLIYLDEVILYTKIVNVNVKMFSATVGLRGCFPYKQYTVGFNHME